MKYAIAFAALLAATPAMAQIQTYTTTPLLGGSSVTTGPNGYNATTMPLLGGSSVTTVNPGYAPPPPVYSPPLQYQYLPNPIRTPGYR